mmetsp:Transcript_35710/g.113518  ORF Transcript_35710/g.113518 Transcript_35710/m.113518 type:complete len:201 (-) Transcript_35710:1289-1891(-)
MGAGKSSWVVSQKGSQVSVGFRQWLATAAMLFCQAWHRDSGAGGVRAASRARCITRSRGHSPEELLNPPGPCASRTPDVALIPHAANTLGTFALAEYSEDPQIHQRLQEGGCLRRKVTEAFNTCADNRLDWEHAHARHSSGKALSNVLDDLRLCVEEPFQATPCLKMQDVPLFHRYHCCVIVGPSQCCVEADYAMATLQK